MTDILRSNEMLFTNQTVASANGEYVLVLQADGNMVLYEKVHNEDGSVVLDAAWATNTVDRNAAYAMMREDGNFVLAGWNGVTVWESETHGNPGAYLQLKDDGSLVINEIDPIWAADMTGSDDEDDEDLEEEESDETAEDEAHESLESSMINQGISA